MFATISRKFKPKPRLRYQLLELSIEKLIEREKAFDAGRWFEILTELEDELFALSEEFADRRIRTASRLVAKVGKEYATFHRRRLSELATIGLLSKAANEA